MLLIEITAEVEEKLQHQRLKGESLQAAVERIISASYAALVASGDVREP